MVRDLEVLDLSREGLELLGLGGWKLGCSGSVSRFLFLLLATCYLFPLLATFFLVPILEDFEHFIRGRRCLGRCWSWCEG